MKQVLLSNWNLIRVVRLIMGVAIVVQAIMVKDILFGAMGLLLTALPLFNLGCCTTGYCAPPVPKQVSDDKEIAYEEVV